MRFPSRTSHRRTPTLVRAVDATRSTRDSSQGRGFIATVRPGNPLTNGTGSTAPTSAVVWPAVEHLSTRQAPLPGPDAVRRFRDRWAPR